MQQTRGKIVHAVLYRFFDELPKQLNHPDISISCDGATDANTEICNDFWENADELITKTIQNLLAEEWFKARSELDKFALNRAEEAAYFEESLAMLLNWAGWFRKRLEALRGLSFAEAFFKLTPIAREWEYISVEHSVRGIIDAVELSADGDVTIIDYKTTGEGEVNDYKIQLATYAQLYTEFHGKMPEKVGVHFLKDGVFKAIPVDPSLLAFAKSEFEQIHIKTASDNIEDYPQVIGSHCKWSGGKCDFYELCFPNGRQAPRARAQGLDVGSAQKL